MHAPVVPTTRTLSANTADTLNLNCWVLGDDPRRIFPVEIASSEVVDGLKKAIEQEKKPKFDDYAADSLDLWRVSH